MNDIEEPLELSAPLAWRLAPQLCRGDPATGENCAWLHGFWQCLRLMGLAATPERHADFYRRAFERISSEKGAPRVLVSGAADYSMLAHALALLRARGIEPAVTVIDLCDTPLFLNRWYAERENCRIETFRCSVFDYAAPAAFDAVCTHSFLGQFSRESRPRLVAAWRRALRPGGLVITSHPLRPFGADEQNHFSDDQAQALRAVVRSKAEAMREVFKLDPLELMAKTEIYLAARYGYPVRSLEEISTLFGQAGFEAEHLSSELPASGGEPGIGGPGLRGKNVHYASLIARRL